MWRNDCVSSTIIYWKDLLEKNIARTSDSSDLSSTLWYCQAVIAFNWEICEITWGFFWIILEITVLALSIGSFILRSAL